MQDGSTPLHYAAAFGQSSVVETLVNGGCSIDATDDAQNTPLHLAAGELSGHFALPSMGRVICRRCILTIE